MTAPATDEVWTPEYWRGYCESDNPSRRYKLERDRALAVELLRPGDGERLLEVGCGYGRISSALLATAAIRLVGVDRSAPMVTTFGHTFVGHASVCLADARRLPFRDGSFDGVLCNGVLMHVDDQASALAELGRVVRAGGRLAVTGNNVLSPFALAVMAWVWWKSGPLQRFKTPWFYSRHLARAGFEVQRVVGDTVFAVSAAWLPRRVFDWLRWLDRWVDRAPLRYFAYETWLLGVKPPR